MKNLLFGLIVIAGFLCAAEAKGDPKESKEYGTQIIWQNQDIYVKDLSEKDKDALRDGTQSRCVKINRPNKSVGPSVFFRLKESPLSILTARLYLPPGSKIQTDSFTMSITTEDLVGVKCNSLTRKDGDIVSLSCEKPMKVAKITITAEVPGSLPLCELELYGKVPPSTTTPRPKTTITSTTLPAKTTPSRLQDDPANTTPSSAEDDPTTSSPSSAKDAPATNTPSNDENAPATTAPSDAEDDATTNTPSIAEDDPTTTAPSSAKDAPASTSPSTVKDAPIGKCPRITKCNARR